MKTSFLKYLAAGLAVVSVTACTDLDKADYNNTIDTSVLPTVATGEASTVINAAAMVSLAITEKGDSTVKIDETGIIYDTDSVLNPTVGKTATFTLDNNDEAFGVISGLLPGTKYYYRAYVSTQQGIALGEVKSFTTSTENYEQTVVETADFSDPATMAGFSTFGTISDGVNSAPGDGWEVVIDHYGLIPEKTFWLGSTSFNTADLLNPDVEPAVGYDADNVLTRTVDLTGLTLPTVAIELADVDGFIMGGYYSAPGAVTVYASESPITSFDDLASATTIGTYTFALGVLDTQVASFSFPPKFSGKTCYVAIRSQSSSSGNKLGVLLLDFSVLSYQAVQ